MKKIASRFLMVLCGILLSHQVYSYDVTAGMSGGWFDPSHDGEGYFLQVLNESQAVIFWFSYDANGNQYWMFGVGDIAGSKITFNELMAPNGGKFGPDFNPEDVNYPIWGTLELDFSDCDTGVANYSGPAGFGSGTLNLIRLTRLWGLDCQGNQSNTSSSGSGFLNGGFSGSWFDFAHNGEGFVVEVLNETTAIIIWFTYDTEGNPAWVLGSALIDGASMVVDELRTTSGGEFGPGFDPDKVVFEPWGPAVFSFGSCNSDSADGIMRYIPPQDFGIESTQFLYRLVSIHGMDCAFLSPTYDVKANMSVAENIFLDGDVNDPLSPEVSNDLDADSAQQLAPPAKVAGYVTAVATGQEGDRFAEDTDEWDSYLLPIKAGESISLNISDWDPANSGAVDLDLYLVNINDPETTVDSSTSIEQTEWVTATDDGNYLLFINAYAGSSSYLLRSGQSEPQGVAKISASLSMRPGELIAGLRSRLSVDEAGAKGQTGSRVEKIEKQNGLHRMAEDGEGDVLYHVDNSRVDLLVPHPLTHAGRGSITAEDWQVIRAAKALSASGEYRWAGPNYLKHHLLEPNDPNYGFQWHYPLIKLPQAWDVTRGSSDVVVAVIDSGVHDHPDLVANVNYSLGYDFVSSTLDSGDGDGIDNDARDPGKAYPSLNDYESHGTHVAGTVGAKGGNNTGVTGVNWDVTIMPVRVLGVNGNGSCWDIHQGMKWAAGLANASGGVPNTRADIINLSLGGSACPGGQDVINSLIANDVIVVAASGNENSSVLNYPASFDNVISVGATTFTDERAPYSSYGNYVDVAAPGGDSSVDLNGDGYADGVLSTGMLIETGSANRQSHYSFLQGTSMASPHVAGIAALMKSVYPAMGPQEFFSAISSGRVTVDLAQNGSTNKDIYFGYGRIDVQRAVDWALEQSQGQAGDAFLTSSVSSVNFGSTQQSLDFQIAKGGSGDISITGGGTTEAWLEVYTVNTDGNGLGTYRIVANRTGLLDGAYSGWVGLNGSDSSQIWISVAMQVGEKVDGQAGNLYALLLDSWTLGNVKQWGGTASNGEYNIDLSANPPGTYFMMVGSDLDNDGTICDAGEFCQVYPLNSQASDIVITNQNVQLGNFVMGFPEDEEGGNISTNAIEPGEQGTLDDSASLISRIGREGVARKR